MAFSACVCAQLLGCVWLFATPWTAAHQASLSLTISWSLLKLMSIESVMASKHLILCCPLFLPSIFPSIRVFSNESLFLIRWPDYWSFSFSVSPSNEYSGLTSFRIYICISYIQITYKICFWHNRGLKMFIGFKSIYWCSDTLLSIKFRKDPSYLSSAFPIWLCLSWVHWRGLTSLPRQWFCGVVFSK